MISYIVVPVCFALLLAGIFSIVWLRSNIISLEYQISELEKQRLDALRETKMTMAEIASLLSFQRAGKAAVAQLGFVFPDRTKVVSIKEKKSGPYRASLEERHGGSQTGSHVRERENPAGGTL